MNTFEYELRMILGDSTAPKDTKFIGRACYTKLDDSTNLKLEFVTLGCADKYDALEATVLNRSDGVIDSATLRFEDLFGKKKVNNPNFRDGIVPYIWENGEDAGWYVYHPTNSDYSKISEAVNDYAGLFAGPVMEREQAENEPGPGMRM